MQKIKIVTDSCLDIPQEMIKKNNIEVLPVLINFGEESYIDMEEINPKEMQERIEKENILPTTSQVTPSRFEECFRKNLEEGYKVIAIIMSSNMSGTYQSACLAKNMVESDDIVIIDTQTITSGQGLLVLKACKLRDEGLSLEEIEKEILNTIPKVKSSLAFESLENLVRGGRISKAAGAIGTALGLRIILEVKDGIMSVKDKVRGSKKAFKKIISDYEAANVDPNEPVMLLQCENPELYAVLKEYLTSNNIKHIDTEVGCAVGIHSGPKAGGLFFITK
ncbi:DegV family protein [Clostridium septicum]|uniref:DegV family protein n=1 Tax=Clostridium septicum TaxID=1504 RepID=A0A9N7PLB0_CLOSE|nr:DegV family protein [Clostridium septicum]AYE33692.1 DegV family protein [Clostridium septicum]MDU1313741.1 DegV family protein [Clostridium septicum]QAS61847.1 DegV family protein [Clostridium septicum]UEC21697.1 DegV family protein [Clostridium septicum]USS00251.1 DegV family protein [Clostridium septicum]